MKKTEYKNIVGLINISILNRKFAQADGDFEKQGYLNEKISGYMNQLDNAEINFDTREYNIVL